MVSTLMSLSIAGSGSPIVAWHHHAARNSQQLFPMTLADLGLLDGATILTIAVDDTPTCDGDILSAVG